MGDEQVYAEDLCRAAGVSERTLRNVFYEHFGIAPHRYLMIARLNRVRAAIREAAPGDDIEHLRGRRDLGFRPVRPSVPRAVRSPALAAPRRQPTGFA